MNETTCPGCGGAAGALAPGCSHCASYLMGRRAFRAATRVVVGLLVLACLTLGATRRPAPLELAAPVRAVRSGPVLLGVDRHHGNRPHKQGGPAPVALDIARARGFDVRDLHRAYTPAALSELEVLLLGDSYADVDATDEEAQHVARWVHAGGVFIVNPLVWVAESYGKKRADRVNVNVLTRPMGVFSSPRYLTSDVRIPGVTMREYDMILGAATFALDPMLAGVQTLGLNGLPGQTDIEHGDVLVWSTDRAQGGARQPLLVRVSYGQGYVIAYQHESLFGDQTLSGRDMPGGRPYDNRRLYENLLDFVRGHCRPAR